MRKMATVRKIDSIRPIPDADAIECAVVGGWTVVVKKGEFKAGDLAVYCEIDSFIPTEIAPFLSKGQEPKEFEGVKGERLRTVKLRGQLSQGLLIPLSVPYNMVVDKGGFLHTSEDDFYEGEEVSEILNIKKYEAPIPAQLAGEVKGMFPGFIPKTDQERIQNLSSELKAWREEGAFWEVTEKLDGSSMTVYVRDGEIGVCSRNLELKRNTDNSLWKAVANQGIEEMLIGYTAFDSEFSVALQGELIGEGIQGNPYKIRGQKFYIFDIYDIAAGAYYTPAQRKKFIDETGLAHVPVMDTGGLIQEQHTMANILEGAEGKSALNNQTEREGLVFKRHDGKASFKAISNKFLIKNGG
jgi:RNA ligase (TIGR02306 family)